MRCLNRPAEARDHRHCMEWSVDLCNARRIPVVAKVRSRSCSKRHAPPSEGFEPVRRSARRQISPGPYIATRYLLMRRQQDTGRGVPGQRAHKLQAGTGWVHVATASVIWHLAAGGARPQTTLAQRSCRAATFHNDRNWWAVYQLGQLR
jgi:hypothetical protein